MCNCSAENAKKIVNKHIFLDGYNIMLSYYKPKHTTMCILLLYDLSIKSYNA